MNPIMQAVASSVEFVAPTPTGKAILAVLVGLIVLERLGYLLKRERWSSGDAWPNIVSTAIDMVIDVGVGGLFVSAYAWVYQSLRLLNVPNGFFGFAYAFVLIEFVVYLQHWLYHRVGVLWAIHSVHHSSTDFNIAVASRGLWAISLFTPMMLIIPFLGIDLPLYGMVAIPRTIWGLLIHTRLVPRLGAIDKYFNTPSNHRVHHGRQAKYLDKNFSSGFILFDRIFGTYQQEEDEPDYGLVEQVKTRNPFLFQIAGFQALYARMKSANKLTDKLKYLYKAPEWSHRDDHELTRPRNGQPDRIVHH